MIFFLELVFLNKIFKIFVHALLPVAYVIKLSKTSFPFEMFGLGIEKKKKPGQDVSFLSKTPILDKFKDC